MKQLPYYPPLTELIPVRLEGNFCATGDLPDYNVQTPGSGFFNP